MNDRDIEDTRMPKEEPEAKICNACGEEMEYKISTIPFSKHTFIHAECNNPFCPEKFDGIALEMAEALVHEIETRKRLEKRVKFLSDRLGRFDPNWR